MIEILAWVVFGLVVGLVARLLYPGRQAIGMFATIALGIVGSLLGGFIAWALGFAPIDEGPFRGSGWIMSIIGALIVVWASLAMSSRGGSRTAAGG